MAIVVARFEVVVIGAGPAGLSAAAELARDCLILDRGPVAGARARDDARDILDGVGGAGLFSDGKHSFFPSATALWQLPDRDALAAAFEATARLLARHGVPITHPDPTPRGSAAPPGGWRAKLYPSRYVAFAERLACIEELWRACPERWSDARVIEVERRAGVLELVVERAGQREVVEARQLVIATGRWSPYAARPLLAGLGARFAFLRDELGVRIETAADHPLFDALPGVDGKLVLREGDVEIRTFCTCRDGEVVLGDGGALRAFSGRADGPPTGRSNVGLVVRGRFPGALARIAAAAPLRCSLAAWLADPTLLVPMFGDAGAAALHRAILRLQEHVPALLDATIHAPVVEGVGDYPVDDGNLQIADRVWIAGDACGRFRGIVASMVSGRYVARQLGDGL